MTQTTPPPQLPVDSPPPGHDIFTDPTIKRALDEDPLFRFLKRSWKEILIVLGAIGAIWYARLAFRDTYEADMRRAGDVLGRAQQEALVVRRAAEDLARDMADLAVIEAEVVVDPKDGSKNVKAKPAKDGKDQAEVKDPVAELSTKRAAQELRVAEATKRFEEGQRKLKGYVASLKDAREPYASLAAMYAQIAGDSSTAVSLEVGSQSDAQGFIRDVITLFSARQLLLTPDRRAEARQALMALASGTSLMATASAVVLYRTAQDDAERVEAQRIVSDLEARMPEQAELLKTELHGSRSE